VYGTPFFIQADLPLTDEKRMTGYFATTRISERALPKAADWRRICA